MTMAFAIAAACPLPIAIFASQSNSMKALQKKIDMMESYDISLGGHQK